MIKGIIFDMDGVLVNSEKFYFDRRMAFLDEKDIEPSSRDIKDYVGLSSQGTWENMIVHNPILRRKLKKEYEEYSKSNPISYVKVINEGIVETIKELKKRNYKLAIASSSDKKLIVNMMEECGLSSYIDYFISGEECKKSKPDPEIYIRAAKGLKLRKDECIAVEDSCVGIAGAKAAGIHVLALQQKDFYVDQREADEVIVKITDIFTII